MFTCNDFSDYEILDATNGEKLERYGELILVRPDPAVIWNTPYNHPLWNKYNAKYTRSSSGGGSWKIKNLPSSFNISYRDLTFKLKAMNFKHTGIFPEQAPNWNFCTEKIKDFAGKPNILNLFGYTGCASVACAKAGANVCHVDASKGIVAMAKENASLSGVSDASIRYIVDDCIKFIEREHRRSKIYDGIIMDPPSYGRGPGGEVWKLEQQLYSLLLKCSKILSDKPLFFILNSYSTGFSAMTMSYMLGATVAIGRDVQIDAQELGLKVSSTGMYLPCGSTARLY